MKTIRERLAAALEARGCRVVEKTKKRWKMTCPDRVAATERAISRAIDDDARLIAAAPDLLAALKQALASRWLSIDHPHNRTPEACDIRKAMCDALDKAEGTP